MAILVTGGAGYIGTHTSLDLLNEGHDIVVIDNLSNGNYDAIKRIEKLSNKRIKFYKSDLLDKGAIDYIFKENRIEAVIHFAGLKSVGESVQKPLFYYQNNLISTMNLCEIMSKHNIKKLIFSSSATVYGVPDKVPITEDFPRSATNPYGQSKLFIEHILEDLVISDPTWKIILLRYFNPIGAHPSGLIGEDPKGIPNNLMPFITQVAIGKREKLSVFGNDYPTQDGTGIRDYIHVSDLATGHLKALNYINKISGIDAFNLGTGRGYSVLELIQCFEKISGIKIPYEITKRRPGDVAICYADPSKAQNMLDWKAQKSIEEMLTDSWNWQMKNPNGYL